MQSVSNCAKSEPGFCVSKTLKMQQFAIMCSRLQKVTEINSRLQKGKNNKEDLLIATATAAVQHNATTPD